MKYKEKKLDKILKTALLLDIEPEEELNRSILEAWKENSSMKKDRKRKVAIAVAACMILATGSVLAATKYLKMGEVAEKSGIEMEHSFFEENVTEINETKEAGEYRFTLLGIASGEAWVQSSLSQQITDLQGMYAAVAIERLDGTSMADTSDEQYAELRFFISPLIAGLKPWQYNIVSMNGGYTDIVEDGILYRLISCDDIALFADRELYLCISDTVFYDTNAYQYDENSGKISRNTEYDGINLLFSLPIDASKADRAAAAAYLERLEQSWTEDSKDEAEGLEEVEKLMSQLEILLADGKYEEALTGFAAVGELSVIAPDKDGTYCYEYSDETECTVSYFYPANFINGRDYMISYGDSEDGWVKVIILVLTENEDKTVTVQRYEKKNELN